MRPSALCFVGAVLVVALTTTSGAPAEGGFGFSFGSGLGGKGAGFSIGFGAGEGEGHESHSSITKVTKVEGEVSGGHSYGEDGLVATKKETTVTKQVEHGGLGGGSTTSVVSSSKKVVSESSESGLADPAESSYASSVSVRKESSSDGILGAGLRSGLSTGGGEFKSVKSESTRTSTTGGDPGLLGGAGRSSSSVSVSKSSYKSGVDPLISESSSVNVEKSSKSTGYSSGGLGSSVTVEEETGYSSGVDPSSVSITKTSETVQKTGSQLHRSSPGSSSISVEKSSETSYTAGGLGGESRQTSVLVEGSSDPSTLNIEKSSEVTYSSGNGGRNTGYGNSGSSLTVQKSSQETSYSSGGSGYADPGSSVTVQKQESSETSYSSGSGLLGGGSSEFRSSSSSSKEISGGEQFGFGIHSGSGIGTDGVVGSHSSGAGVVESPQRHGAGFGITFSL